MSVHIFRPIPHMENALGLAAQHRGRRGKCTDMHHHARFCCYGNESVGACRSGDMHRRRHRAGRRLDGDMPPGAPAHSDTVAHWCRAVTAYGSVYRDPRICTVSRQR